MIQLLHVGKRPREFPLPKLVSRVRYQSRMVMGELGGNQYYAVSSSLGNIFKAHPILPHPRRILPVDTRTLFQLALAANRHYLYGPSSSCIASLETLHPS